MGRQSCPGSRGPEISRITAGKPEKLRTRHVITRAPGTPRFSCGLSQTRYRRATRRWQAVIRSERFGCLGLQASGVLRAQPDGTVTGSEESVGLRLRAVDRRLLSFGAAVSVPPEWRILGLLLDDARRRPGRICDEIEPSTNQDSST